MCAGEPYEVLTLLEASHEIMSHKGKVPDSFHALKHRSSWSPVERFGSAADEVAGRNEQLGVISGGPA
jgi:hypothetical protein